MPRISVIIPNYNHEKFLKLRIESILSQTFQDFELIILDDRSTDNSKGIIEQYRHHDRVSHIIYNEQNSGSAFKQWEKGVQMAKGDWVWIAESDDYCEPDFLESLIPLTTRYDNVGIALSSSYQVDNNQQEQYLLEHMTSPFIDGVKEVKERLCYYNTITNVSACIINRQDALQAVRGLGEFKTCGDWIFYVRLLQHVNLAYLPKKLNYYRWHENNISFTACKNGTYVTEGINVIKDIDFSIVRFSTKEFLALSKGWLRKILKTDRERRMKPLGLVLLVAFKFFIAKLSFKPAI